MDSRSRPQLPEHLARTACGTALSCALLILGASGPASGATPGAEKFQVRVPPVSPTYGCKSSGRGTGRTTTCKTDYALAKPLKTSGDVTFDGAPRLKGDMTVTYNQYEFAGRFRFAKGTLQSASGKGSAQATWAMRFADSARSMLWGTFVSRDIRIRKVRGSRVRLTLSYAVEVSGGSGRFAGLVGACAPGRCKYDARQTFTVRRPGDLPLASRSALRGAAQSGATQSADSLAGAGELDLGLEPGNPRVELALPGDGRLEPQDPRPLQVSAPPGSTCVASARDPRSGAVIDLGQAIANANGAAVFRNRLLPQIVPLPQDLVLNVECTPPAPILKPIVPATAALRTGGGRTGPPSRPAVVRIVNNSAFRMYERLRPSRWYPPGAVGSGGTEEATFSGYFDPTVNALYHYEGYPNVNGRGRSQGWIDMTFNYGGSRPPASTCSIRVTDAGPAQPTCTVTYGREGRAELFLVTIGGAPF